MQNRVSQMLAVRQSLETEMKLLGITGVEDLLQNNVQFTLETLRNANIKIWMLTGDKLETAEVIARSSKMVAYGQTIFQLTANDTRECVHKLDLFGACYDAALIIDGDTLKICLDYIKDSFIEAAVEAPVVICCRCSPTQKAQVVELVQQHTLKCCAAVGDGGNDVAMIQKSNVGIGIVGKEGKQASLASDFSLNRFSDLTRLILWHGRIAYKNSAKLSQCILSQKIFFFVYFVFFFMTDFISFFFLK